MTKRRKGKRNERERANGRKKSVKSRDGKVKQEESPSD